MARKVRLYIFEGDQKWIDEQMGRSIHGKKIVETHAYGTTSIEAVDRRNPFKEAIIWVLMTLLR